MGKTPWIRIVTGLLAIGAIAWAAFSGWLETALGDLLEENAPRIYQYLLLLIPLALAVALFFLGLHLWTATKQKTFGGVRLKETDARFNRPVRVGGLLVALTSGITACYILLVPLGTRLISDIRDVRKPADVQVTASPLAIGIHDICHLSVTVDGEPPKKSHRIKWKVEPELKAGKFDSDKGEFQPQAGFVEPGKSRSVVFTATVFNSIGKEIGTADVEVLVSYRPVATITVHSPRVFVGEPVNLTAQIDGKPPKGVLAYTWTPNDGSGARLTSAPTLEFTPDIQMKSGVSEQIMDVALEITKGGELYAKTSAQVTLVARRPYFTTIVLDASQRMSKADTNGVPFIDVAKKEVESRIDLVDAAAGNIGVWAFGDRSSGLSNDPCKVVTTIAPLGHEFDKARQGVAKLEVGGKDAPLNLALMTATKALSLHHAVPRARFEFLTVTAGLDTCDSSEFTQVLARLKRIIADSRSQQDVNLEFEYVLLGFTIAIVQSDRDADMWQAIKLTEEYSTSRQIILTVDNAPQLSNLMGTIAQLNSPQLLDRLKALNNLISIADKQRDKSAVSRLQQYRKTLLP